VVAALVGAGLVGAQPALASSGMTCSTAPAGDSGYRFYCSGSRNVTNPWASISCVNWISGSVRTKKWVYYGTKYAPFSYGQTLYCGSVEFADQPNWGPR
jgi:hypothetical protein